MRNFIKATFYLILINVFSSIYNLKASDQDLTNQYSKYLPSLVKEEHAETFSNKRKKHNINEDDNLPKNVIQLIAKFVDTPIAYQKLKVTSKR